MSVISLVIVGNVMLFLRSMPFYSATADSEIGQQRNGYYLSTLCMVHRKLAAQWRMPVELAIDVAVLALYDIVIMAGVLNSPLNTNNVGMHMAVSSILHS